jgi:hypothetical protein
MDMTELKLNEILTPASLRWGEFTDALVQSLKRHGCDAQSQRHAKRIIAAMGGIDVEGSLAYFRKYGGYCDCEILINVEDCAPDEMSENDYATH